MKLETRVAATLFVKMLDDETRESLKKTILRALKRGEKVKSKRAYLAKIAFTTPNIDLGEFIELLPAAYRMIQPPVLTEEENDRFKAFSANFDG
jgi:hypothetical protein